MRRWVTAALLLLAACATVPPLRPADPAQAVPNQRSAATAFANGVRIVVRPEAWQGYHDDLDEHFLPVEIAIQNGSGRPLEVRPAAFSVLAPNGFRYEALSTADVRRALAPYRASPYAYGYTFYALEPWSGPFYPWYRGGAWGWGPALWYGARPYGYGLAGLPSSALAQGTLEPGGRMAVLVFFPVPAVKLRSVVLEANLVDAAGEKVAQLSVPFVRGGGPAPTPLPPTAAPPAGPSWETVPPPRTPAPGAPPPPPPVDTPVGPPVEAPQGSGTSW